MGCVISQRMFHFRTEEEFDNLCFRITSVAPTKRSTKNVRDIGTHHHIFGPPKKSGKLAHRKN